MEDSNKGNVRLNQLDPGVFDSVYTFKSNVGDTYEITFNDDGSIQNIESSNKRNYPFDLDAINNYWVDRGFELSHAIAATFKEKGPGGEDALGLGYYNESKTINEIFKKHLGLLHERLGLIKEGQPFYQSYPDGTEIEVDRFTGKLIGFIYKGNFMDILDFKDLGFENGWRDEDRKRINPTLKAPAYRLSLNRRGTHEMVFYPEASGGPVYFSMDSSD